MDLEGDLERWRVLDGEMMVVDGGREGIYARKERRH